LLKLLLRVDKEELRRLLGRLEDDRCIEEKLRKNRLNENENYPGVLKEIEDAAAKFYQMDLEADRGESILDCLLPTQKC
jgi:hypothetical protein